MSVVPPATPTAQPNNGQAIASLVLGVLSLVFLFVIDCVSIVAALLAIFAGVRGLVDAKKFAGRGKYMSMAGMGLAVLAVIVSIVRFNFTSQQVNQVLLDQIARATGTAAAQQTAAATTPEPRTFNDEGVTLTYPATWETMDISKLDMPACKQTGITCLLVLTRQGGGGVNINVMRIGLNNQEQKLNVDELDEAIWTQVIKQSPDFETVSRDELEVNGLAAIKRIFTKPDENSKNGPKYFLQLYVAQGEYLYQITGSMFGDPAYEQYAAEVETIATSLVIEEK